jgi:hypothetical protein
MRLKSLSRGQSLKAKVLLKVIGWSSGREPLGVIKTLLHRPRFFAGAYNQLLQETMRGPSRWSVGERELFATFTSHLNQCRF